LVQAPLENGNKGNNEYMSISGKCGCPDSKDPTKGTGQYEPFITRFISSKNKIDL